MADLRAIPDEELIRAYGEAARLTTVGLDWYREELNRRLYERDAEAMRDLTQRTVRLTVVTTAAAVFGP